MSICVYCEKDSSIHSKKQWKLHKEIASKKQVEHCTFCNKEQKDHTEKLWEIHKSVVEKMLRTTRHKSLWTMRIGFGSACKAILDNDFAYDKDYNLAEWLKPIYMSCSECKLYLGKIEEDYADILGETAEKEEKIYCLKCFREQTEQTDIWYDIPPVLKGKQCVVCSTNFFGRSDSDKCGKHRECKTCELALHTHTWRQKMECGNVIFDPDWHIKKQAEEEQKIMGYDNVSGKPIYKENANC